MTFIKKISEQMISFYRALWILFICFSIVILFIPSVFCATVLYDDPTKVGIGARPVGMGKAFTAVADDGNAIFINPAGLGTLAQWNIASMNTTFMDEYQYMVLSLAYPTSNGTYGFGYVSTRVGQIPVSGGDTVDFENKILLVSYSRYVGDYFYDWFGREEEVYAGANIKYLSKGFSGAVNQTGDGFNMDLGVKYTPSDNKLISYGLNIQNILPTGLGGNVGGDYVKEEVPLIIKSGVAYKFMDEKLLIAIDNDMYLGRSIPWPFHIGAEWKTSENLVLRGGFDQTIGGDGSDLATNPCFGLGLNLNGFIIDFAYKVDFDRTGTSSNYVSFTIYGKPMEEIKRPAKKVREKITQENVVLSSKPPIEKVFLTTPGTKEYTFDNRAKIQGKVDPDVSALELDGRKMNISEDGKFDDYYALKIGKNRLVFKIKDLGGKEDQFERKVVRLYLPQGMSVSEIETKPLDYKLSAVLIVDYLEREYMYNERLTRAGFAILISKSLGYDQPLLVKDISADVSRQYWGASHIQAVMDKKLMSLYSDGTFRPSYYVTRSELVRSLADATGKPVEDLTKYLVSPALDREATMGDVLSVMYNTEMFKNGISDY